MRLRDHTKAGTITDAPLSNVATTFNSAELAALPTLVSSTDYYVAVFDPAGLGNGPEIVYITIHTVAATVATIIRGKEDTSGVEHAAGTDIVFHPFTSLDFHDEKTRYAIDLPLHTPGTPDDEFEYTDGSLDAKWTLLVSEAGNTVTNEAVDADFMTESDTEVHWWVDKGLTSKHWIANSAVAQMAWGQDYTLPDGKTIVAKGSMGTHAPDVSGSGTNEALLGLWLNDDDSGHRVGNDCGLWITNSGDDSHWQFYSNATALGQSEIGTVHGDSLYFAIHRIGTTYYPFYSSTGRVWQPGPDMANGNVLDNMWLWSYANFTHADVRSKAFKWDWVREGDFDTYLTRGTPW